MRAMPMIMIVSSLSLKGGDRIKEEHITEWQKKMDMGQSWKCDDNTLR